MSAFDAGRIIGIDWSGAAKPRAQEIYVAELVRDPKPVIRSVVRAADRVAVERFLAGQELTPGPGWESQDPPQVLDASEKTIVGLDFAFGFPAEFDLPGKGQSWAWDDLAVWCATQDEAENLGDAIAGNPGAARQFRLGKSSPATMRLRLTEQEARNQGAVAESVFNLVGSRQVGRGSIRGIAMLARLRKDHVSVWPFDEINAGRVTALEVFPRIWLSGIGKMNPPNRVGQLKAWEDRGIHFEKHTGYLAAASPDAMDAVAAAVGLSQLDQLLPQEALPSETTREGWIAGT